MTIQTRLLLGISFVTLALAACETKVSGPTPALSGDASPSFVCQELDTWLEVSGTDFSPLVVGTLEDPHVVLPTVTVTRRSTIEGDSTGELTATRVAGEGDESAVRWIDGSTLNLRIRPDSLEPGIYDVTVKNEAGESATRESVFGVVPRPTISAVVDQLICVAQGERALTVEGDFFIVDGDEVPTLTIPTEAGDKSYTPTYDEADCRSLAAPFGSHKVCTRLAFTLPSGDVDAGIHDVVVKNADPAPCDTDPAASPTLVVVSPPTVAEIVPDLICSEQIDYEGVHVRGVGFLKIAGDAGELTPTIDITGTSFSPDSMDGCVAVEGLDNSGAGDEDQLSAEVCTDLFFALPAGTLDAGGHDITVENPAPAGCHSTDPLTLTVVPPPVVSAVTPNPVCTDQAERLVTISGEGFVVVDSANPSVRIGDSGFAPQSVEDCVAVEGPAAVVETCSTLSVLVPEATFETSGSYDVVVTNPETAPCQSEVGALGSTLVVVPPPAVTDVLPPVFCAENAEATLTLAGTGFLNVDGALPTVSIGANVLAADALEGCQALDDAPSTQTCTSLTVTVPVGLAAGPTDLTVTNPGDTDCVSEPFEVAPLPAPIVTAVTPALFCGAGSDTAITVSGQNFFTVEGLTPTVVLGDTSILADSADTCAAVPGATGVEICESLTVTVPDGSVVVDVYELVVQNPAPIGCTNDLTTPVSLVVAGSPAIDSHVPEALCRGQFDGALTLAGSGFFRVDGATPSFTINGDSGTVDGLGSCTNVDGLGVALESCESLDLTVPVALRDEDLSINITNPAPADCASTTYDLVMFDPPDIQDVQPRKICSTGGMLDLTGDHFEEGMTVALAGERANSVVIHDATSATASWSDPLPAGLVDLVAENPTGCSSTFATQIRVTDGPLVFFMDPAVLYNGIAIQATIYLGNLFGGSVTEVFLTDDAGVPVTPSLDFTYDPARPSRLQVIVPAGLAPGLYDVTVLDDVDCAGTTGDLVEIVDQTTLALTTIEPPFGWTTSTTAVRLGTADPAPGGEVQFEATPRVYLSPANPQPGDLATELRGTTFVGATELNGIVDSGLDPGDYDVIVVNPGGEVGVIEAGYTVTSEAPPLVDTVSPGSWETGDGAFAVTLAGANFNSAASVTTECRDAGGGQESAAVTVLTADSSTISATVDTNTVSHMTVCVVIVTNPDGSFSEISPITITNPAGNFVDFLGPPPRGGDTLVARRAPGVSSGVASRTSKFIYVFGGDDGDPQNAYADGEVAVLDRFGAPGPWAPLRYDLPTGRTMATAVRNGDFVYLVAGHDGTGATADVSRAIVLDPLYVPSITAVDFDIFDNAPGMATGVYYYRVSAVFDASHPFNPGGETLASDPQPVFVPDLGLGLHARLEWSAIADASGYRIYRSSQPDLAYGHEELLAEVAATELSFTDDGAGATVSELPLPVGSLGRWHSVATLTTPRMLAGAAFAVDPAQADRSYLYVAGGDDGASVLDSIEVIPVDTAGPRAQSVGTPTTLATTLSPARSELQLVVATTSNASLIGVGESYLYALSGRTGVNTLTDSVEAALVPTGGALGGLTSLDSMTPTRSGYAAAVANNTLVVAGGQGGGPSATARKGEICGGSCSFGGEIVGSGWTSLGNVNMADRYLMGSTSFNGFIFMVGGLTDGGQITMSTDYSVLGGTP